MILLLRLSLTSSQQIAIPTAGHSPVGYDLWQRNSNGISHIDSDSSDKNTVTNKSSPDNGAHAESSNSFLPFLKHPSSNYVYKNEPLKISAIWQFK